MRCARKDVSERRGSKRDIKHEGGTSVGEWVSVGGYWVGGWVGAYIGDWVGEGCVRGCSLRQHVPRLTAQAPLPTRTTNHYHSTFTAHHPYTRRRSRVQRTHSSFYRGMCPCHGAAQ